MCAFWRCREQSEYTLTSIGVRSLVHAKFRKFKVDTKKTQENSGTGGTTRRRRKHRTEPRITDLYETRNQDLKWKRVNELKEKSSTGKEGSSKGSKRILRC